VGDCLNDSELDRYHADELDAAGRRRVEEHLGHCVVCARRDAKLVDSHDELLNRIKSWNLPVERILNPTSGAAPPQSSAEPGRGLDARAALPPAGTFEGYEVVRELHRGGQGVVFQAMQCSTKRKVAIKVLLEGPYASELSRRRFEREVELVARLKHPNIVPVFDFGVAQDGRQYCVMDYVRGVRLDQYVREKRPTLEEVLRLFTTVCDTVNYAHQRGVIHRDLKPSNIVVDAEGHPKVLDFGLAKQVSGAEEPALSVTGQVVGTLPYMAPEQARGRPDEMDIRTDVYALGVILYEILTGHYPYPVVGEMADVLRHITDTHPDPPSRTWTPEAGVTLREHWGTRTGSRCPLDSEVETIIFKALAKERERRYQSALDLGRDIGLYLTGRPIEARRDSRWYVFRKTLRRYRVAVAVAALFVLSIVGSAITLSVLYRESRVQATLARQQRDRARTAEAAARRIQGFLADMFAFVSPERARGRDVSLLREVLDEASARVDKELSDQPRAALELHTIIGTTYANIAAYDSADVHLRRACDLAHAEYGDAHAATLAARRNLGELRWQQGRLAEAESILRDALGAARSALGADHEQTLLIATSLAVVLKNRNDLEEAERLFREVLAARRRAHGAKNAETLQVLNNLGTLTQAQGSFEEAERLLREAYEGEAAVLGEGHPQTLVTESNLALLLSERGRLEDAERVMRHHLDLSVRVMGADHPATLSSRNNLGHLLQRRGRLDEAEAMLREALAGRRKILGEEHPHTLLTMSNLSACLQAEGKLDEAERMVRRSVDILRRVQGPDTPSTLIAMNNLGTLLNQQSRFEQAERIQREVTEAAERTFGEDHWTPAVFHLNHADTLTTLKRFDESEAELLRSVATLRKTLGEAHVHTRTATKTLIRLYEASARPDEARRWREALASAEKPAASSQRVHD